MFCLPSRFRPQGCYYYYLPSRFHAPERLLFLFNFEVLPSRLLLLFTFEVSPSRLLLLSFNFEVSPSRLLLFTFEVSPSRLLSLFTFEVLPSRLFYLPSRFRPQGCVNFASEALPSVFFWAFIGLPGASTFCLTWLVPAH